MNDLIFDANSFWARCFFAAAKSELNPCNVAMNRALQLLRDHEQSLPFVPERLLFCWDDDDVPKPNREPKPEGYHEGQAEFEDASARVFNAAHASVEGFTADDVVATAALASVRAGNQVIVVSGDKDLEQLARPNLYYFSLNKRMVLTPEMICAKWKISQPNQVALAFAIQGDSIDGIKGVPKFGPKKCAKLFEKVTADMNLNQAYQVIRDQVPEELRGFFDESLKLTLLKPNVPGVIEPSFINLPEPVER